MIIELNSLGVYYAGSLAGCAPGRTLSSDGSEEKSRQQACRTHVACAHVVCAHVVYEGAVRTCRAHVQCTSAVRRCCAQLCRTQVPCAGAAHKGTKSGRVAPSGIPFLALSLSPLPLPTTNRLAIGILLQSVLTIVLLQLTYLQYTTVCPPPPLL